MNEIEISNEKKAELLHRDKEIRAQILGEFFSRITWVNAGGIVLAIAFLTEHPELEGTKCFTKGAVILFSVSLALALGGALRRYHAAFVTTRRDRLGFSIQISAAILTALALLMVAFGAAIAL